MSDPSNLPNNASVSFDALLIGTVIEGRSPELISRFGPTCYQHNAKEAFRTFVREEVQQDLLFPSTTNPGTGMIRYCSKESLKRSNSSRISFYSRSRRAVSSRVA